MEIGSVLIVAVSVAVTVGGTSSVVGTAGLYWEVWLVGSSGLGEYLYCSYSWPTGLASFSRNSLLSCSLYDLELLLISSLELLPLSFPLSFPLFSFLLLPCLESFLLSPCGDKGSGGDRSGCGGRRCGEVGNGGGIDAGGGGGRTCDGDTGGGGGRTCDSLSEPVLTELCWEVVSKVGLFIPTLSGLTNVSLDFLPFGGVVAPPGSP